MTARWEILRNGVKQERSIITAEGYLAIKRTVLKVKEETLTVPDRENREMESGNKGKEWRKERIPPDEYLKTDRLPFKMTEKMIKDSVYGAKPGVV